MTAKRSDDALLVVALLAVVAYAVASLLYWRDK